MAQGIRQYNTIELHSTNGYVEIDPSLTVKDGTNDYDIGFSGSVCQIGTGTGTDITLTSGGQYTVNTTGGISYNAGGGSSNFDIVAGTITFDDQWLSAPIPVSESGTTGLVGYTATSIVGALNEAKSEISAESIWDRTGTTITAQNSGDILNMDGPIYLDNQVNIEMGVDGPGVGETYIGTDASYNIDIYNNGRTINLEAPFSGVNLRGQGVAVGDDGNTDWLRVYTSGLNPEGTTFNYGYTDSDFIIRKETSGDALVYDAGDDDFTFGSVVNMPDDTKINFGAVPDAYIQWANGSSQFQFSAGTGTANIFNTVGGFGITPSNASWYYGNAGLQATNTQITANNNNNDVDFVIGKNGSGNAMIYDAGTNRFGFGITPTSAFHVDMGSSDARFQSFQAGTFVVKGKASTGITTLKVANSLSDSRAMELFCTGDTYGGTYLSGGVSGQVHGLNCPNVGLSMSFGTESTHAGIIDDNQNWGFNTVTAPHSGVEFGRSVAYPIKTVSTTSDTLDIDDYYVRCDASSNAVTINLPTASGIDGRVYIIKAIDVTNTITIDGNGAETIDGNTTVTFASQYDAYTLISNGTNWDII